MHSQPWLHSTRHCHSLILSQSVWRRYMIYLPRCLQKAASWTLFRHGCWNNSRTHWLQLSLLSATVHSKLALASFLLHRHRPSFYLASRSLHWIPLNSALFNQSQISSPNWLNAFWQIDLYAMQNATHCFQFTGYSTVTVEPFNGDSYAGMKILRPWDWAV